MEEPGAAAAKEEVATGWAAAGWAVAGWAAAGWEEAGWAGPCRTVPAGTLQTQQAPRSPWRRQTRPHADEEGVRHRHLGLSEHLVAVDVPGHGGCAVGSRGGDIHLGHDGPTRHSNPRQAGAASDGSVAPTVAQASRHVVQQRLLRHVLHIRRRKTVARATARNVLVVVIVVRAGAWRVCGATAVVAGVRLKRHRRRRRHQHIAYVCFPLNAVHRVAGGVNERNHQAVADAVPGCRSGTQAEGVLQLKGSRVGGADASGRERGAEVGDDDGRSLGFAVG